ncbi:DEAD/DEAH box helicase family protein [Synechococcus sp. GEYO]|uniref:DEAD/DEAH box helicase family protein n=1 Tax=Synechococcus sp. GEYO TaxID=2575511 RepID=UPI001483C0D0|nr:DEAD/DEAH box helicase family protein [Synechococcus sp. GEYO]
MCGKFLNPSNWEADHIQPWSKGGPTEHLNGQALCIPCHQSKMTTHPVQQYLPQKIELRKWQEEFAQRFLDFAGTQAFLEPNERKAFILNAFPGSGKTIAQLAVAKYLTSTGLCDWFTVVVPSDKLRSDFVQVADLFGLRLYGGTNIMNVNFNVHHGIVLTYQQLASDAKTSQIALWTKTHRTFVTADEIHHLSDKNSWGENFELAFEESTVRLLTTGTPFRSDHSRIPWCSYVRLSERLEELDLKGSHAYSYSYDDALADGVVREVEFPTWSGRVQWRVSSPDGMTTDFDHTFDDDLEEIYPELSEGDVEKLMNQRNRFAVEADTQYIRDQILAADQTLQSIRQTHPWAGGLIVCQVREHADAMGLLVEELTGEKPVVVHGDVEEAKKKLGWFQDDTSPSRERWLITVQMVTEGVDIKHLRVLVYATNKTAPLFWTQVLGRILRHEPEAPLDQTAVFYQYGDERLREYAKRIHEAIQTHRQLKDDHEAGDPREGPTDKPTTTIEGLSAEGEGDVHIFGGKEYSAQEVAALTAYANSLSIHPVKLIALLEAAGDTNFWDAAYKAKDRADQIKGQKGHQSIDDSIAS